ncbi:hypothetical protein [Parasitella parasitica]|uniref:UDENN FLCN/SMCR8-type domain-containing protein n=1 Tax=Parasitella parasitica TaxID=35722 RepID=A0A0B7NJQ6_9FUNG|nr:hypothetical protein [Parasitella parasitica]
MTHRKEELSTLNSKSFTNESHNCWWSDQVLPPADQNPSVSYRDFVLISEFSELEGPLPLAVVTEANYIDLKHYTNAASDESLRRELQKLGLESFDFNSFVLRVVSVDRSTEYEQIDEDMKVPSPMTPSALFEEFQAPCLFSIPDDTQVYFTDSEHKFFAFTHHLTLFDINARGYVHPVALSYITRDPNKIVIRFQDIMEKFNEVASLRMKKGNYSNFTLDLKCRLLDLEYTQSTQNSSTNSTSNTVCNRQSQQQKPVLSLQAIQQAITATKLMIDTLESSTSQINNLTINSKTEAQDTLTAGTKPEKEPQASKDRVKEQHSIDPPKDYKPKFIDTLYPVAHFERKLRSLAQLCQEPDELEGREETDSSSSSNNNNKGHIKRPSIAQKTAAMIPLVFSMIEPNLTPSSSSATTNTIALASSQRPTFANAITHDMYAEAIKYIQNMTHCLGKSSVVLDVNEEEESLLKPKSSVLTFGHTFMLNMDNPKPREKEDQIAPPSPNGKQDGEKEKLDEEKDPMAGCVSASFKDEPIALDEANHVRAQNDEEPFYPILFAPTQLWKSEDYHATKTHLLQILRRYHSLIVDVIFSLLIGRTVIIQGSEKNKSLVQQVVQALSVFVPGQSQERNQIIEWYETTKLTDAQIKGIKLVGVDKNYMDPSIHIDSSCVLDIDMENGSLHSSPVYVEGQWINQLLDRMTLFSSDESYLAYLHTVFMNMSLKAFVYHHLYVCDEFKLDESPSPSTPSNNAKGYSSETNSESSNLSRKWSVRLMNYLKKHEDQESNSTNAASTTSSMATSVEASENEDDNDYSEENQATVTLQSLGSNNNLNQNKPKAIMGLFQQSGPTTAATAITVNQNIEHTTFNNVRRKSFSTIHSYSSLRGSSNSGACSSSSSDNGDTSSQCMREDASLLGFGLDDLKHFGDTKDSEDSSSSVGSEDGLKSEKTHSNVRKGKHRLRKPSDIGPDGVSFTERRGRRYLQEKLKVYGDDQTIVVVVQPIAVSTIGISPVQNEQPPIERDGVKTGN